MLDLVARAEANAPSNIETASSTAPSPTPSTAAHAMPGSGAPSTIGASARHDRDEPPQRRGRLPRRHRRTPPDRVPADLRPAALREHVRTVADALALLDQTDDLAVNQKRETTGAVTALARATGRTPDSISLRPVEIRPLLRAMAHGPMGASRKRLSDVRSALRAYRLWLEAETYDRAPNILAVLRTAGNRHAGRHAIWPSRRIAPPGDARRVSLPPAQLPEPLLAESLDRFARDLEHVAALHKLARFAGVRIVTLAEGRSANSPSGARAPWVPSISRTSRTGPGAARRDASARAARSASLPTATAWCDGSAPSRAPPWRPGSASFWRSSGRSRT